jgi:uncharacterized membrane protein (DUF2068 family)
VTGAAPSRGPGPGERDWALRLIALFKFCKVALLVAIGLGALHLLQPDVSTRARQWLDGLAARSDSRAVRKVVSVVVGLSPGRLEALGIGAFLYAALFTVEGVGLWLGRRWAEYLTVGATLFLVPLEVFELTRGVSPGRVSALVLNLAVAAYLMYHLQSHALRRTRGP